MLRKPGAGRLGLHPDVQPASEGKLRQRLEHDKQPHGDHGGFRSAEDLYTDSAYLCNALEKKWLDTWSKNGWKTASKSNVENQDLWKELIVELDRHDVQFHKVKGHADNEYNNRCDKLARDAVQQIVSGQKS